MREQARKRAPRRAKGKKVQSAIYFRASQKKEVSRQIFLHSLARKEKNSTPFRSSLSSAKARKRAPTRNKKKVKGAINLLFRASKKSSPVENFTQTLTLEKRRKTKLKPCCAPPSPAPRPPRTRRPSRPPGGRSRAPSGSRPRRSGPRPGGR